MALEGSLKEFSLADILQLIFFQKKTGVLSLQGRTDKMRILFHEGNIIGAESKKRDSENRLGNVLLKRGVITEENLNAAIEKQKTEGIKFGALLVKEGFTTKEAIQDVIKFQITETMVQLFSWKEGRYEFTPQSVPLDKDIGLELDTQHFLMEGLRFVDEWSEIGDRVTIETVFVRTDQLPGELSEEEMEILGLVDGNNDIGTISDISGKDSFSVSTTLLSLQDKGLVVKKQAVPVTEEKVEVKREAKPIPQLAAILAGGLIIALIVSLAFSIISTGKALREYAASEGADALRYDIETYMREKNAYPPSVAGKDPWGNPYIYKSDASAYSLSSSGADATPDTADDIR